jgi:hypothetical protein
LNNLALFGETRHMYPFVISDATSDARRYTLWAGSERERAKWKEMLEETLSIRAAYVDANKVCIDVDRLGIFLMGLLVAVCVRGFVG